MAKQKSRKAATKKAATKKEPAVVMMNPAERRELRQNFADQIKSEPDAVKRTELRRELRQVLKTPSVAA